MRDDEVDEKVEVQSRDFKPRGIYIRKEDLREENYGMTPGCKGCEAANRGITAVHNERCRFRIEKAIEGKEPDRYARVMTRLGVESKGDEKKRAPSEEDEEMREDVREKKRKTEQASSSSTNEEMQSEWACPRCSAMNPMIYKFCPNCTGNQKMGETSQACNSHTMYTSERSSNKGSREERE